MSGANSNYPFQCLGNLIAGYPKSGGAGGSILITNGSNSNNKDTSASLSFIVAGSYDMSGNTYTSNGNIYGNSRGIDYINSGGFVGASDKADVRITAIIDTATGASKVGTACTFKVSPDSTADPIEAMRISSSGNVGIGTQNPQSTLDIYNAGGAGVIKLQGNTLNNIGIGNTTLTNIRSGSSNTGFGLGTLASVTTGVSNTAVGHNALQYCTLGGSYNTAVGFGALANNNANNYNTALGHNSFNTNSGNYTKSTAIGYNAQPTSSNQIVLGTLDETVSVPGNLDVSGTLLYNSISYGSTLDNYISGGTISYNYNPMNLKTTDYTYVFFNVNGSYNFSLNTTLNNPATIYYVIIGGGGGGGASFSPNTYGGGGGGGGNLVAGSFTISSAQTITVTVGNGGNPGINTTGQSGVQGSESLISPRLGSIIAYGGSGGEGGGTFSSGGGGAGGAGGSGAAGGGGATGTGSVGSTKPYSGGGGGGSGSGGSFAKGGQPTIPTLADGTDISACIGGFGGVGSGSYNAGYLYPGCGGSGNSNVGVTGKDGCVMFYFQSDTLYYPTSSLYGDIVSNNISSYGNVTAQGYSLNYTSVPNYQSNYIGNIISTNIPNGILVNSVSPWSYICNIRLSTIGTYIITFNSSSIGGTSSIGSALVATNSTPTSGAITGTYGSPTLVTGNVLIGHYFLGSQVSGVFSGTAFYVNTTPTYIGLYASASTANTYTNYTFTGSNAYKLQAIRIG
jgi:hypothetical protein